VLPGRASCSRPRPPAAPVRWVVMALPSITHSGRPVRVYQHHGGLVRLAAHLAVAGPEARSLETQHTLRRDTARLDAEHTARGQCLAHHRKYAAFALAVQHKGLAHGFEHVARHQQLFDLVFVE
jgi:hypothetical protein